MLKKRASRRGLLHVTARVVVSPFSSNQFSPLALPLVMMHNRYEMDLFTLKRQYLGKKAHNQEFSRVEIQCTK